MSSSPDASSRMSSRSIGVTNVEFRRWMMSYVIRSPSCSQSRIARARPCCSGNERSISSSSSAARSTVAAHSSKGPKKAGVVRGRRAQRLVEQLGGAQHVGGRFLEETEEDAVLRGEDLREPSHGPGL